MAHGLAKNSLFLPAPGRAAPRCRLSAPAVALAGAANAGDDVDEGLRVEFWNCSGPSGEAAMLGR